MTNATSQPLSDGQAFYLLCKHAELNTQKSDRYDQLNASLFELGLTDTSGNLTRRGLAIRQRGLAGVSQIISAMGSKS